MANNFTKTMRQALQEAREYRDTTEGGPGSGPQKGGKKFSSSEIKKAYGILNDPRYKQGNYTGAAKAINKLAPGLADHPDVKNAMKRANENLDLPATGDTTTSNASQEVEQVEDLKEYTGMSISRSVNSNQVATTLKNLEKGTKLHVMGKPQNGMRTMGDVISISGDTVKIKPTASNGPTSVKVKDITFMDVFKEELDEARFSQSQIDQLKKAYTPLSAKATDMHVSKLKNKMKSYSISHLRQLSTSGIPMVSDAAKELLARDKRFAEETELDDNELENDELQEEIGRLDIDLLNVDFLTDLLDIIEVSVTEKGEAGQIAGVQIEGIIPGFDPQNQIYTFVEGEVLTIFRSVENTVDLELDKEGAYNIALLTAGKAIDITVNGGGDNAISINQSN